MSAAVCLASPPDGRQCHCHACLAQAELTGLGVRCPANRTVAAQTLAGWVGWRWLKPGSGACVHKQQELQR